MKKINFSKEEYISILTFVKKQNYIISPVKHAKKIKEKGSPVLILRHDVDLDMDAALLMAQLEKENNIQSSYFILLYNNFYNPLSPENKEKIIKIKNLGHEIGIHWDFRDYLNKKNIHFEGNLKFLSEVVGEKVISGSRHEPNSIPLSNSSLLKLLKFEAYRDFKEFVYISDSSMQFRQDPYELIKSGRDIQFLIHPFWWMTKGKTRKEKFDNFISELNNRNNIKIKKYYSSTEDFLKNRDKDKRL